MATEGRVSDVGELLKIDLTYSNYHTVFPKLIIYLLTLLGIVLIIKNVVNKMKIKKTAKKEDIHNQEIDKDQPKEKLDRKSTRLNSSHVSISYAVFCLKKKNV